MSTQYLPWSSHISTPPSLPYYHLRHHHHRHRHHYHSLSLVCYNFRQFSSFLEPMTGWGYQNYQAKMKSFSVAICKESLFLFVVIRLISVSLLLRIGGTRALKRGISPSKLLSQVCSKGEVVVIILHVRKCCPEVSPSNPEDFYHWLLWVLVVVSVREALCFMYIERRASRMLFELVLYN